ncbi:MAG: hypothetical protein IJ711_04915 [Lachnospiraceae bacterium]|nr:hypothetical protein [Lachnospiraceae bacterium]
MEPEKQTVNPLHKFVQGLTASNISGSEYLFLFLATVVEVVMPVTFFFLPQRIGLGTQLVLILLSLQFLFAVYMDIQTFFQKNYVDYLFLQLVFYCFLLLISAVLIGLKRDAIAAAVSLDISTFHVILAAILCFFIYAIVSFVILVVMDIGTVLILIAYAKLARISLENPYVEQLKAAATKESFEEYTNRRVREEFAKKYRQQAQERAESTGHMHSERHKAVGGGAAFEGAQRENDHYTQSVYVQMPLFDYTVHFKDITSLDQVRPRYHALMKKYHPDNAQTDTVRICQEIQKEYHEIAKKYNL